jgi:DNA recombination protein RmuC
MEPLLVALLVVAVLAVSLSVALLVSRQHQLDEATAREAGLRAVVDELAGQRDAQINAVVERVLSVAGESFDGRLQTGAAELEQRRQVIDQRVDGMQQRFDDRLGSAVKTIEARLASVDSMIAERVGGVSDIVGERVGHMSKSLGQHVTSMSGELHQLRDLVAQLQKERAQQHGQLVESLRSATAQQRVLTETTQHLREALASPQARGQWGERMAEDVLRTAGMREGINYRKQTALEGGTKPDFTFLLPDQRLLHMDVKFPVTNYLRHLEAPTPAAADGLRDRFLKDVRERVKELLTRGYATSDTTVGYVLMFIPNESVFGFIHENDPQLLDHALSQKVVMCSPTSLFAVLAVVRQAMDTFGVERASEEILDCLARFGDQWERFSGQVDKVDRHLLTLTNSFGELAGPRRRQLERQLARIDDVRSRAGLEGRDSSLVDELERPVLRDVTAG